ncbi:cyclic nucleotide-binding domain-containing protein [Streptomyces sp. ACA25]|uniref:Crp/Fnr family transcriptional regulator n=1 Tax=Streptomyces sp. ACA25 TaxID=3022596 RepID=UPI0023073B40|nr:cyclic nucleotide-binding domain-containing protein [Streptomyces sp. ACA25]MDB1089751.1 cyclic nucleotide-binding domain-containing protein [Streptomyces sp. ACA25]
MSPTTGLLARLPPDHRERLRDLGREVAFPIEAEIFAEGGTADRFWIIRTGSVTLCVNVPGRRVPIETLGHGELLGWSWLFPPYVWHLGAVTGSPVRALEFDAGEVRELCRQDSVLGLALTHACAEAISQRLQEARARLADAYRAGAAPVW